ncbi:hypothetical protein NDU88_002701 [Pleurodeles waltl]|uniref:Uncharacterized protein n=1 Tax=Pleurodeles waltl TaxID=8319 RepID=A0AAV7UAJ1_PLEWA|nr:hypothetical protein NDU88_002701 [Pleurodeles waltl]
MAAGLVAHSIAHPTSRPAAREYSPHPRSILAAAAWGSRSPTGGWLQRCCTAVRSLRGVAWFVVTPADR